MRSFNVLLLFCPPAFPRYNTSAPSTQCLWRIFIVTVGFLPLNLPPTLVGKNSGISDEFLRTAYTPGWSGIQEVPFAHNCWIVINPPKPSWRSPSTVKIVGLSFWFLSSRLCCLLIESGLWGSLYVGRLLLISDLISCSCSLTSWICFWMRVLHIYLSPKIMGF